MTALSDRIVIRKLAYTSEPAYIICDGDRVLGHVHKSSWRTPSRKAGRIILSHATHTEWRPFVYDSRGRRRGVIERGLDPANRRIEFETRESYLGCSTRAEAVRVIVRYWETRRSL